MLYNATIRTLRYRKSYLTPLELKSSTSPLTQVRYRPQNFVNYATSIATNGAFQSLGIHENLQQALIEQSIYSPTSIQKKCIQAILNGKDIICQAQTGTGKTLAYLLPVLTKLLHSEAKNEIKNQSSIQTPVQISRPSILVVVPSRELAIQVGGVAKQLAHVAKFASCVLTSGERKAIQQKKTARHLDFVVGTPGRIAKCIEKKEIYVSQLTTLIVDEADTLCDAKMGFKTELDAVLHPIQESAKKRQVSIQTILAAATVQSPLDTVFRKKFGNLEIVRDDNIHQVPSIVKENFIRVTLETKHSALRGILEEIEMQNKKVNGNTPSKTLVFCQSTKSCQSTDHMLRENDFRSSCLHGEMPPKARVDSIENFQTPSTGVNILVCTDLAARGLDFPDVNHVIMFDFPKTPVDYVHRAGRTGRAGKAGVVTSLVTKYDAALARSVAESHRFSNAIKELGGGKNSKSGLQSAGSINGGVDTHSNKHTARKHGDKKSMRTVRGVGTKKKQMHKIRVV